MARGRLRRGIYLLPTMFTIASLFCGFASLVVASAGQYRRAAILIIVAGILDGLDGRIARLTGTTSEFGLQFDSLADLLSFGVAPAILVICWSPLPVGKMSFVFLYVVCAAMRLARFNIRATAGVDSKRFFAGLPSPAAAGLVASMVCAFPEPSATRTLAIVRTVVLLVAAFLMVSRFRYHSFKDFDLRNRRSFMYALAIAVLLVPILAWPEGTLLLLATVYVGSGPALYLGGLLGLRRAVAADESDAVEVVDGPAPQ